MTNLTTAPAPAKLQPDEESTGASKGALLESTGAAQNTDIPYFFVPPWLERLAPDASLSPRPVRRSNNPGAPAVQAAMWAGLIGMTQLLIFMANFSVCRQGSCVAFLGLMILLGLQAVLSGCAGYFGFSALRGLKAMGNFNRYLICALVIPAALSAAVVALLVGEMLISLGAANSVKIFS